MRRWMLYSCFFLFSCGSEPGDPKSAVVAPPPDTLTPPPAASVITTDSDNSPAREVSAEEPPVAPPIKKPSGIYQFVLPDEAYHNVLQTIAFSPGTYRLQEEYRGPSDSIVVTRGTWAPSAGYIWLYKDQVVRGRYTWKGDTLQYYSPALKKAFPLQKLTPVTANEPWQTKKQQGSLFYGVGTEPFWSVEVTQHDTLVFSRPDWPEPLRMKLAEVTATRDSTVYAADSLRLIVYPYFCTDGMSDFLYSKKVKLVYKGHTLRGCGEVLKQAL